MVINTLLEISIMVSIMILIIWTLKKLFSNKLNSKLFYGLWLLVLLRLLLFVTIPSPVSIFDILPTNTEAQMNIAETEVNKTATENIMNENSYLHNNVANTKQVFDTSNDSQQYTEDKAAPQHSIVDTILSYFRGLSISSIIFATWLMVVILLSLIKVKQVFTFKRKLKFCNKIDNEEYLTILNLYKSKLKIKTHIKVLECNLIQAPSSFGFFRPYLLIPSVFIKIHSEQKKVIILHELCHIRRKDILLKYLWTLTRIIYWFNPLVWLAFKKQDENIEVCCDAMAVNILGNKYDYSEALIHVAHKMNNNKLPIPVTSLCKNKSSLNERITNIVKPKRNSKSTIIMTTLLVCIMLIGCFTTACQPTPENNVIVGKGNEDLLDKINQSNTSTASPNQSAPIKSEVLKDTFKSIDGMVTFVVDANVKIPDVDNFPVLGVKPGDFSSEQIKDAATALFDSADFYSGKDLLTKSIIQDRIVQFQQSINEYKSQNKDGIYDYAISELEDAIKRYQEQYDTATDELPKNPPEFEFVNGMVNLYSDMNGNEIRTLDVSDSGLYSNLMYLTNRSYVITNDTIEIGKNVNDNLSYSDAKAVADKYLNAMGVDSMDVSYVRVGRQIIGDKSTGGDSSVVVNGGDTITNDTGNEDAKYDKSIDPCYVFYYTRNINGVLTTYVNQHNGTSVTGVDGAETYREPWKQEYIEIYVDKDGIAQLNWNSPTDVVRFESENVPILSLEDAKSLAKEKLQIMYNDYFQDQSVEVTINEVKLGMTRIAVKGKDNQYMFVPTWDFFGYYTQDASSGKQTVSEKNAYTMLTINAIDSSIIDRGLEY